MRDRVLFVTRPRKSNLILIYTNFQLRDLRAVGVKFYHVLYPKEKAALLKECKFRQNRQ